MREHAPSLATARAAAADLAVILATVRAALGGTVGRAAGNLLEVAELDVLSARDAIEKPSGKWISYRPGRRVGRSPTGGR
jgi:hypothetical protein